MNNRFTHYVSSLFIFIKCFANDPVKVSWKYIRPLFPCDPLMSPPSGKSSRISFTFTIKKNYPNHKIFLMIQVLNFSYKKTFKILRFFISITWNTISMSKIIETIFPLFFKLYGISVIQTKNQSIHKDISHFV